jgi:hypothetical protein
MKASEIIAALAKGIEKYGDKRVLVNKGEDVWYELDIRRAGDFWEKQKRHSDDVYMYFDMDLT